jgi:dsDNA-binding SOS-regulon protein
MEKNLTKWIPLDVDALEDTKVMSLVMALGLEGYGIYIMLIQFLAKQEPDYTAPIDALKLLAYRNHISEEKIKAVVMAYGLFELDGDFFFTPALCRRMEKYNKIKDNNRKKAEERWARYRELYKGNATALPEQCGSNAQYNTIHNNTEHNKTEEKRKKEKDLSASLSSENSFLTFKNHNEALYFKWIEWESYRKKIKKPYKTQRGAASAYNKVLDLSDNNSELAIAIIDQSLDNEWLGFFPLKIKEKIDTIPGESAIQRLTRQMKEKIKFEENGNQ